MSVIQRVDIQQRLTRGLHLKERSPAPVLHDKVVPVVIVDDLQQGETERLAGGGILAFNPGANFGNVQLFNPAGSGVEVLVDELILGLSAGNGWVLGISNIALATLVVGVTSYRDVAAGGPQTLARLRTEGTVAFGGGAELIAAGVLPANTSVLFPSTLVEQPILVMPPGTGVTFSCAIATTLVYFSALWRERALTVK